MTISEAKEMAEQFPLLEMGPQNVVDALAAVMRDLPAIGKSRNPDGGINYAYRGIEAITGEAQGLFGKYGIVFVPRVVSHETRDLVVNNKPWTDTVLLVEYDICGPHNTKLTVGPLMAIGRDNSDKGANKAMTQAYKYALLQVLCISDKKDDGDSQSHEADARPVIDPQTEEALHELSMLINGIEDVSERETLVSHLRGRFGPSREMTPSQIEEAMAVAAGWPETAEAE